MSTSEEIAATLGTMLQLISELMLCLHSQLKPLSTSELGVVMNLVTQCAGAGSGHFFGRIFSLPFHGRPLWKAEHRVQLLGHGVQENLLAFSYEQETKLYHVCLHTFSLNIVTDIFNSL